MVASVLVARDASAAATPHVVTFGRWTSVQCFPDSGAKPQTLKIRALAVDGRVKEYVLGSPHEVTDRLFVVQRVFRMNDSLPEEPGNPHWQWQRGGWLLVNRKSGHISAINLPEFDTLYSVASWFRDYVAYCGVGDEGEKQYAIVAQMGRRKPIMKNPLSGAEVKDEAGPDSSCAPPVWQRSPVRVTFEVRGSARQTFAIRGHEVDLVSDADEEEGSK